MDNEILLDIVRRAKKSGADDVDILLSKSNTITVATRLTKPEKTIQADVISAKMRVSIEKRSAVVTTNNLENMQENSFIEKAIFAAKNAPEESVKFRPENDELCKNFKKIDMCSDEKVSVEKLLKDAEECEDIALGVSGITNSEGAEASFACSEIALIKNENFINEYKKTRGQISVVTLAEKNGELQRDYDFSKAVYYSDLKTPEQIAKKAAEKTLKKLGAKKIKSCKAPVVFSREVSRQLLSSLLDALNGAAISKGISFLKDKLSQQIFNSCINVTDRYAVERGLRSRPFDSEGLECRDNFFIKGGVINSFLLNTKHANRLKMRSTSSAYGFEGIAPNNVCIENGNSSVCELMSNIQNGLYVTEVLGNGLNIVTGNYSQGAVGFWIENGEISYPVHEITIAGNFIDMFKNCQAASDLIAETGVDSPTLFMEEMVIGGI